MKKTRRIYQLYENWLDDKRNKSTWHWCNNIPDTLSLSYTCLYEFFIEKPSSLITPLFVPFRPSHPLICPCLHIYIQWHKPSMPSMMFKFVMRINVTSYICHDRNTLNVNVFLVEINLNSFWRLFKVWLISLCNYDDIVNLKACL